MEFPIYGGLTTKRGVYYRYSISKDHRVEVWKNVREIVDKDKPTAYRDKSVFVEPTKEILERLSEEYGFEVKK